MSRSQESFNKKEVRNKKEKKRKEKEMKKQTRKDSDKGSFDDMIAYVDENGMITSTPPDPSLKKVINLEDIEISIPKSDPNQIIDPIRKGSVTFFNTSKGFGFIRDLETQESVFVHVNNLLEDIKEGNLVNYEVEMGQKGPTAVQVKLFKEPKPVAVPTVVPPTQNLPE
ncbi:cold shock protein CspA [Aquipluma nitroreducens]|uniref:Cold shock protein CspA n=1 Tax=Aquipluma nitroreducens TaxID=2010828 RepID=A0A5K7S880_9BACT|nr:cold shock domain-containing protein [Aquipluma nitroreducens]BBE17740.1 cold shock protein CspA [Aquipluma nitroreducens]